MDWSWVSIGLCRISIVFHTKERHCENGTDVTSVESKEDTTKTGESTHEVGLDGDRRLNALDVISSMETATHNGG